MSPTARSTTILQRFPRHLEADSPGKTFGMVVDGLSGELDTQTVQLGRIRRGHAVGDADEAADALLLAGLHGLRDSDFTVLAQRFEALAALRAALPADAAVATLPALLGLPVDAFPPYPSEGTATGPARDRLRSALRDLVAYSRSVDELRASLLALVAVQRDGNASVAALVRATAAALALAPRELTSYDGGYWHVATALDRLRLVRPEPPGSTSAATPLEPAVDLLAIEENPFQSKHIDPIARAHGDIFRVLRGGLEPVTVTVRVVGKDARTVAPMVVNLDTGFGLAFTGSVPDSQELRFESDGRVTLSGASVARLSYAFRGGVLADEAAASANDFLFGPLADRLDRQATFATTEPVPDAFSPGVAFPHADGLLEGAQMGLGESRWAYFVGAAHYGRAAAELADELPAPQFLAGILDSSVFEPGSDPAGLVGFEWQEREPFALRVWLPQRFAALDRAGELPVRERIRLLLDRFRATGVHVYVQYADDHWALGAGLVRDPGSTEPLGSVVVGTRLWPDDTPQPSTG